MNRAWVVFILMLAACQRPKERPVLDACNDAYQLAKTACETPYPDTAEGNKLHKEFCDAASKEPLRASDDQGLDQRNAATCQANADQYEREALELIKAQFQNISDGATK